MVQNAIFQQNPSSMVGDDIYLYRPVMAQRHLEMGQGMSSCLYHVNNMLSNTFLNPLHEEALEV